MDSRGHMARLGRAPLSNLGEGGSAGRVYKAVANIVAPMLLASSHPRNDFSIKGLGPRIPVWPMDLSSHFCVRLDTTVDGRLLYAESGSSRL